VGAQDHQGHFSQQGALKDSTKFPGQNMHWLTPINTAAEPIVQFFFRTWFHLPAEESYVSPLLRQIMLALT
jgi:hypothetical protein